MAKIIKINKKNKINITYSWCSGIVSILLLLPIQAAHANFFGDLWDALCKLDYRNLQIVCREFEGLATLCKQYGDIEGMRSDFTNSKGEEYK